MKNLNLSALKIAIVAVLLPATFMMSCKKDESVVLPVSETGKIAEIEFSKLFNFIAISTGAPKEEVIYDKKNEEFVVYGWFHKSLKDAKSEYEMADEYKATYEK
ncbi:hypothetical protein [Pedobacter agri]|uniref:hypothetical protein n=1 Tax=Pedobacter agri TaxID=454586 RepID=UPI00292D2B45|nr:hypothetical protein [Pedobacter agri]